MAKQKTRKFGGKIYKLADFSSSRRMANTLASDYRNKGYLARVTSGGRPVFYDVWVRKQGKK